MLLLCHPCRCSDSEAGLGDLTKALMGVRALLDERIGTLRKKQEFDTDADFARRLQAELEQEDNRRQVVRPGCPGARQHQGAAVPVAVVVVLGFSRGAASAAAAARCSLPGACEAVLTLLVGRGDRRRMPACCRSFWTGTQPASCATPRRTQAPIQRTPPWLCWTSATIAYALRALARPSKHRSRRPRTATSAPSLPAASPSPSELPSVWCSSPAPCP